MPPRTPLEIALPVNLVRTPLVIDGEPISVVKGVVCSLPGIQARLRVARMTGEMIGRSEAMISLPRFNNPMGTASSWDYEFEAWDTRRRYFMSQNGPFKTASEQVMQDTRVSTFNDIMGVSRADMLSEA